MSVNVLSDRYDKEKPHLEKALAAWTKQLKGLAQTIDRNVVVDGRVKGLQSLLVKAYKDGKTVAPRTWGSFSDLVALKVIFPTLSGAAEFTQALQTTARANGVACSLDPRRPEPASLSYSADQFDLCDPGITDSAGDGLKVEVQVRTVASDAWYMVDHRLRYKNMTDLPPNLERRVLRLIVLTELFDEEVDSLIKDVAAFETDTPAGVFKQLRELFTDFTKSYAPPSRPEGLFEILMSVVKEVDRPQLIENLRLLLEQDGERIRQIMGAHTIGAENYVEKYDWLYNEPEALLIAHLARRPRLLASAIENSDFEQLVTNMVDELKPTERSSVSRSQ